MQAWTAEVSFFVEHVYTGDTVLLHNLFCALRAVHVHVFSLCCWLTQVVPHEVGTNLACLACSAALHVLADSEFCLSLRATRVQASICISRQLKLARGKKHLEGT